MNDRAILFPLLGQVLLAYIIAVVLLRRRVAEMRAKRVHPQALAQARDMASRLDDQRASDSFRNQFETPVLFFVAVLVIHVAKLADPTYVALAWVYVALRYGHAGIHCTYNKVMHRFAVFLAGFFALALIWARLAFDLVYAGLR